MAGNVCLFLRRIIKILPHPSASMTLSLPSTRVIWENTNRGEAWNWLLALQLLRTVKQRRPPSINYSPRLKFDWASTFTIEIVASLGPIQSNSISTSRMQMSCCCVQLRPIATNCNENRFNELNIWAGQRRPLWHRSERSNRSIARQR